MLSDILKRVEQRAAAWRLEATNRRTRTVNDPGADALESCANELDVAVEEIRQSMTTLTPEQFGEMYHVTPQTVRNWCRAGRIAGAEHGPGGWRIPRDAKAPLLRVG
jgi:DNA-binding transcriptional regulator YiaG